MPGPKLPVHQVEPPVQLVQLVQAAAVRVETGVDPGQLPGMSVARRDHDVHAMAGFVHVAPWRARESGLTEGNGPAGSGRASRERITSL